MRHPTLITRRTDRLPWFPLLLVFLLQAVIGVVFALHNRNEEIQETIEHGYACARNLESMVEPLLHRNNYEAIPPLLDRWVDHTRSRLVSVEISSAAGFPFYSYRRDTDAEHSFADHRVIPYSFNREAHLYIVWDLDEAHGALPRELLMVGLFILITMTALTLALNLALQRKRSAEELEAEKELLDVTLKNLGDGVIMTDTGRRVVMINLAAERLLGLEPGAALGLKADDIVHLEDEQTGRRFRFSDLPLTGQFVTRNDPLVLIQPDQQAVFVKGNCSAVQDGQGRVQGLVLIIHDMTQTRQLELERRQNATLQAVGLLAGGIAHDFNNLLMAVTGNIQLARERLRDSGEIDALLADAGKSAARAADLTQQLITFSRGGSPVRKATDLTELISEAAGFMLRDSDVTLEVDLPPDLWPVHADRSQLSQVIQNLVLNARQAMPEGGSIRITAANLPAIPPEEPVPQVSVRVCDSGPGILPEVMEKIFNPYFTTKDMGSGLGLAVVHSIITQHDGRIEVASPVSGGAMFTITLPASQAPAATPISEDVAALRGSGRILIMDDDEAVLLATRKMAESLGYSVTTARCGEDALATYQDALASAEPFAAVIMDLTIKTGLGGKETCAALRELDPACRAIVTSGYYHDPIMGNHQEFGFQAALTKPFPIQELGRVLAAVVKS